MDDFIAAKFSTLVLGAVGSLGAMVAAGVQNVAPPEWIQGGATASLVGFLSMATIKLWNTNQDMHRQNYKEAQEREARYNQTNQELIAALNALKDGGDKS
jgi:NAD(P)H-dependent flavin oxidoreductase YrpB (nitropropane dioxygenase family)